MLKKLLASSLFLFISAPAFTVELRELSMKYARLTSPSHVPDVPGYRVLSQSDLTMNLDLFGPVFWDNQIVAMTSSQQFRLVGWDFRLGLRAQKRLLIEFEHFSYSTQRTTPTILGAIQ